MSSLMKKIVAGLVGVILLGMLAFGGDLWSYVSTAHTNVKDAVNDQVPISFQIDRAEKLVDGLIPDIQKNMVAISREEVELKRLDNRITGLECRLKKSEGQILHLRDDLASHPEDITFCYSGKKYTRSQVESDLQNRFERYRVDEALHGSLQKQRVVRERSLETARKKLRAMMEQKGQLEVELQQLAARLEMVELAKTTSTYCFDEGNLGEVKKLVSDLQARLDVEERLCGSEEELANGVILEEEPEKDVTEKITEYFDGSPGDAIAAQ